MWAVCVAYLALTAVTVLMQTSYLQDGQQSPLWLSLLSNGTVLLGLPAFLLVNKIEKS